MSAAIWLEQTWRDVRYALRTMLQQPVFSVTAVLALTLGIGATTAIFTLIDALLLRSLPVREPQELVRIEIGEAGRPRPPDSLSYAMVGALADQGDVFAGFAGFTRSGFNVGLPGALRRVDGALVTGQYYETLGVRPVAGRLLGPDDDKPGAPPAAVLGYTFWQREYAGDPAAVGQTILLNGIAVPIVGVSQPGFSGVTVGAVADITAAVAALPELEPTSAGLLGPGNTWLRGIARPGAGVSVGLAEQRLTAVWPQLAERVLSPNWPAEERQQMIEARIRLVPGGTGYSPLRNLFSRPLFVLMAVVTLVLLIACANVANLLLARAMAREREISVRLAVGAGRARVFRQLLTESALLSLIGASLGIGLAVVASRLLLDVFATGPFRSDLDATPSSHVLAFTIAVAVATAMVFGVAPAVTASAGSPARALKSDLRPPRSRTALLSALACAQIALSLLLLVGAGLFTQTLRNLRGVDSGFEAGGVLLADVDARREGVSGAALLAFYEDLLARVRAIPGVASASLSSNVPLSGSAWSEAAVPAGQPLPQRDTALFVAVMPEFFATLGTRLVAGRDIAPSEVGSPSVAIVNEAFAKAYFGNRVPLGESVTAGVTRPASTLEIVGVVEDTAAGSLRVPARPTVYVSYAQRALTGGFIANTTLEARVLGSPSAAAAALRAELRESLPNAPVEVHALSDQVDRALVQERLMASLAGAFGALGLLLAGIGIYGLLAYRMARQTREIGIRIALGARESSVLWLAGKSVLKLLLAGFAVGLPGAWAASRYVESMLFGLRPTDPVVLAGAVVLLGAAALAAAYFPARRAARLDPMTALRLE
ncbi:MAG TPA: ABC transporter permease [Gammaproteobacteria bacterium]|nr:ABC transporter permease [Gammaproteobacteria bacterium]